MAIASRAARSPLSKHAPARTALQAPAHPSLAAEAVEDFRAPLPVAQPPPLAAPVSAPIALPKVAADAPAPDAMALTAEEAVRVAKKRNPAALVPIVISTRKIDPPKTRFFPVYIAIIGFQLRNRQPSLA